MSSLYSLILALFVALLGVFAADARADWMMIGVAKNCDPQSKTFVLATTLEASEGTLSIPPGDGFSGLPNGDHEIQCTIGVVRVKASVRVTPGGTGRCMGNGFSTLNGLVIGNVSARLPMSIFHDAGCYSVGEPNYLVKVSVKLQGQQIFVERCFASHWDSANGYAGIACRSENPERFRASFDCTKARSGAEQLVCGNPQLGILDHELFDQYLEALVWGGNTREVRPAQRRWLKLRDSCQDEPCVKSAYISRISELKKQMADAARDRNKSGVY